MFQALYSPPYKIIYPSQFCVLIDSEFTETICVDFKDGESFCHNSITVVNKVIECYQNRQLNVAANLVLYFKNYSLKDIEQLVPEKYFKQISKYLILK